MFKHERLRFNNTTKSDCSYEVRSTDWYGPRTLAYRSKQFKSLTLFYQKYFNFKTNQRFYVSVIKWNVLYNLHKNKCNHNVTWFPYVGYGFGSLWSHQIATNAIQRKTTASWNINPLMENSSKLTFDHSRDQSTFSFKTWGCLRKLDESAAGQLIDSKSFYHVRSTW